jgi:hypothetical protein
MRENKRIEIENWCKKNAINLINLRNIKSNGKTRIVATVLCNKCGRRFDVKSDTLLRQKYVGLCTSCAHKESAKYKKLKVQEIVDRFVSHGYKVLTPINKIKPIGKYGLERTPIDIENKYGERFKVTCNNFMNRINYYIDINNENYKDEIVGSESRLECKVRMFLKEKNIPFKQEFIIKDCRGNKKMFPLRFDFCLFYKNKLEWILIEVDGKRHYEKRFKDLIKNDKRKNYYCNSKSIPLLRIPYTDFDNTTRYQDKIIEFINSHK